MKKQFIVNTKQQQHVMQEKRLLMTVRCPFIVRSVAQLTGKMCELSWEFCPRVVDIGTVSK